MMNIMVNIPLLITLSGVLTLFYLGCYWQMATAVIPATISMNQKLMQENQ